MRLYKKKFAYRDLLLSVLVFSAVLFLFWGGFTSAVRANSAEKLRVTRAAVQKAIISCYAVEGFYPPDIQYLEDHYGIEIDHSKYVVQYETAGSNIMPSVQVLEKGAES
ncbi:hypothetical protein [Caproiciproducens faecalis]|uniref:Uncharacterized protein n=1 Tax=Caproiciproducens faecalis TaxID=2820301 RepID=A0ABS7DNS8_9FIRM|nr:hypothetical protein [Caproiciproducens faecalis]MBW7572937.1 hypothetical protein [Caproiciproducens faecalis]